MTKKRSVLLSAFLMGAVVLFSTGCFTNHPAEPDRHVRVLGGLYEYKQASYERHLNTTVPLRIYSLNPATEFGGDEYSLLWGIFTVYDQ